MTKINETVSTLFLSSTFPVNEAASKITVKSQKVAFMKKVVAFKSELLNAEISLFSSPLVLTQ